MEARIMVRSLRTRILLGFTLVVLLVTFVSIWTIMNIVSLGEKSSRILNVELRSVAETNELRSILHAENVVLISYLAGERGAAETRDSIYRLEEQFLRESERTHGLALDEDRGRILSRISSSYRVYRLRVAELLSVAPFGAPGGGSLAFYSRSVRPAYDSVVLAVIGIRALHFDRATAQLDAVGDGARFTAYSTTIIACIILILSVIASLKVSQAVLAPIRQLSESVRSIARGDFRQEISVGQADDELTGLVRDFNAMSRRLEEYDATKLEQIVEEKRRCEKIVSDLSDLIVATDERTKVIYFNGQAESVLGLPARLVLGDHLTELAGEHAVIAKMSDDIANGRLDGREETVPIRVRGRDAAFAYQAQTIRNDADEIIGYVFRLKDITRYKQLDDLKTKVVTVVSHELRTPLTSIGMSLELLSENGFGAGFNEVQRDLLRNMQEDVRRLQSFVNDLLDISRIESGVQLLVPETPTPRDLVEDGVRSATQQAEPHDIRFDVTGVPNDLPRVAADRKRIIQVFNNLFSNAIRYTPYGGTISVSAVQAGGMIRFCVRDNGPGIPLSESRQIFEKFYQIRDDQRAGGSGLGLTIVKEIVESHGGSVWVESAVGQGSSFYFTLPVAADGQTAGGAVQEPSSSA